jgi:hypothetical protein
MFYNKGGKPCHITNAYFNEGCGEGIAQFPQNGDPCAGARAVACVHGPAIPGN